MPWGLNPQGTFYSIKSHKKIKTWHRQRVPGPKMGVEDVHCTGSVSVSPLTPSRGLALSPWEWGPPFPPGKPWSWQQPEYPQGSLACRTCGSTNDGHQLSHPEQLEEAEIGCKTQAGRESAGVRAFNLPEAFLSSEQGSMWNGVRSICSVKNQ